MTPQQVYWKFAEYLIERGAANVTTFDYRGIGGSRADRRTNARFRMKDWALQDFSAMADHVRNHHPNHSLVGIGHSFGGQALGLSGRADLFMRFAMVATLNGYWRLLKGGLPLILGMRLINAPVSKFIGYVPGWMGTGEDAPGRAFRDWTRWCSSPNYFFDDPSVPETVNFQGVKLPLLFVRLDDDPWGNEAAIGDLRSWYPKCPQTEIVYTPDHAGGAIGHFGFFRSKYRETLWPQVADWLLQ